LSVRAGQVLRPKQPRHLHATLVFSVLAVLVFVVDSQLRPWSPKRGLGLAFGALAACVFVLQMLYPSRRPNAWPLRGAMAWLQLHVYAGGFALVAVLVHVGFRAPSGQLGWWLLGLSCWTVATGLLGVWLQKWIPAALAEGLRVEAIYERIPGLVEQLREEADQLVQGASDVLERFYRSEVRAPLSSLHRSWAFLLDVRGGRERALEPFRRVAQFVEAGERQRVHDLMSIYTEKMELDAQYSLQGILRGWLVIHVPPAGLLIGLLAVHVFAWIWY
jgi:hypothetical protein